MTERLPPQSESSEIAFLGACLYDPELAVEEGVAADLKAGDFFKRSRGLVWRAILDLYHIKEAIDVVPFPDVPAKRGRADES